MSKKPAKKRKSKEPFVARMKRRGRETYALGSTLVHNPRAFPAEAGGLLKRSFRTMWDARGGGFYACGFVLTFIWLEVSTFVGEIAASDGVISFFTEQFFEFLFRFSVQSLGNTLQAFIWPLLVLERLGPAGLALLLSLYFVFSRLLKEPVSRWLFQDVNAAPETAAPPANEVLASARNADDDKAA